MVKRQHWRSGSESSFLRMLLMIVPCLFMLAGCASFQQDPGATPLSSEERQEANVIDTEQADGELAPMEADLQKDALQHNIKI